MVGKTKHITKSNEARFKALQEMGCVCCIKRGLGHTDCEIHHVTDCGRRRGHDDTLPLCPWHHRGQHELGAKAAEAVAGPSLALNKRAFVHEFGTEDELLKEVNSELAMRELTAQAQHLDMGY